MLVATAPMLQAAQEGGYAVGAFNVYNMEGVLAVVQAAEATRSPAILQVLPAAVSVGGAVLIRMCLEAARYADVPMAVQLDHCSDPALIAWAVEAGLSSVMADGSHLPYEENVTFTARMVQVARQHGKSVEGELGRLSGTEDGLTVSEYEARLTDPAQAADYVARTGVDALAVCIGNVHGPYREEPRFDFDRLAAIRAATDVPLVLHGASGVPAALVHRAIELGVCKFNVNTELRQAYLKAMCEANDLLPGMKAAIAAMQAVVEEKMQLFGSVGRAQK